MFGKRSRFWGSHNRWWHVFYAILCWGLIEALWTEWKTNDDPKLDLPHRVWISDSLLRPSETQSLEARALIQFLHNNHYKKLPIDDHLSSQWMDAYLDVLDPYKMHFVQNDINYFNKYRRKLDDDIKSGDLSVGFQMASLYKERRLEVIDSLLAGLDKEVPDFGIDEDIVVEKEIIEWSQSRSELKERWRKYLKDDALTLKLAGKDWKETTDILRKRYQHYRRDVKKLNAGDVFSFYINSAANLFDPHTSYFSPKSSDNFNISMSNSLEGIGAQLSTEMDHVVIVSLVPGGPAQKTGKIHKEDKIVGVAQQNEKDFTDVVGWRLDDVVQLIRGPKGTTVRLQMVPHDALDYAQVKEVSIVRDKIRLEDAAAQKKIYHMNVDGKSYKIGVITLPSFYLDMEAAQRGETDFASSTKDVQALLDELRLEKVRGVLIDLRSNGGGSLSEAVSMSGLFIPNGPIVQSQDSRGRRQIYNDKDPNIAYEGPLAVLVNRFSASASEIFAGAMKDYRRAFVFGEATHGKGSVQQLLDLAPFIRSRGDQRVGKLKFTTAKYYRINGSTPQIKGVQPDIIFPTAYDSTQYREIDHPSALSWDQIEPLRVGYSPWTSETAYAKMKALYLKDQQNEQTLTEHLAYVERQRERLNKKTLSLNYEKRKRLRDAGKDEDKDVEGPGKVEDEREDLEKDPLLKESLRLMSVVVKEGR